MTSLGGSISVESEVGLGATFEVLLPSQRSETEQTTPHVAKSVVDGSGRRIMFVDDEVDLVFLARRILERHGYFVEGFTDARQALGRFVSDPDAFDLICCDITMPGMSGIDFAAEVLSKRSKIPFVLMSGFVRPDDAIRAAELGVTEVVSKPDMMVEMPLIVQTAISS